MVECPICRVSYVENTIFCPECGLYLLKCDEITTDPLESGTPGGDPGPVAGANKPGTGLLTIRLRIRPPTPSTAALATSPLRIPRFRGALGAEPREGSKSKRGRTTTRELEVPLTKPVRLGRIDPRDGVYPDVDLTCDMAMESGVSREHACIFRRGSTIEVEDLASTNGTTLNGARLAPYLPVPLSDGDQLELGKLLIEVSIGGRQRRRTTTENRVDHATAS